MVYSLTEGISALGAFGVLIVANNLLCDDITDINVKDIKKNSKISIRDFIIGLIFLWLPVVGITYLSSFLSHIIINSELIFERKLAFHVAIGLLFPLLIPHLKLFWLMRDSIPIRNRYIDFITSVACALWGGLVGNFINNPNLKTSLPIYFFPSIFFIFIIFLAKYYWKRKNQ